MQISTETFGNVLVAHTPEEFNDEGAKLFVESLMDHIEGGHVRVVLQMDRSDLFDSVRTAETSTRLRAYRLPNGPRLWNMTGCPKSWRGLFG